MINRNRRPLKPKHPLFFAVIPAVVGRNPEIILITPPSLPGKERGGGVKNNEVNGQTIDSFCVTIMAGGDYEI